MQQKRCMRIDKSRVYCHTGKNNGLIFIQLKLTRFESSRMLDVTRVDKEGGDKTKAKPPGIENEIALLRY